jgi:hypothetical protein
LENVQQVSISKCGHLDCHDIGTYGMGARAEGSGTTSTKATGKCRSVEDGWKVFHKMIS